MPNTFLSADTHFCHASILQHCNRPWQTIEEHDEALIKNWNSVVSKRDLVFFMGDFAMIPKQTDGTARMKLYRRLRMRLNGKIILGGLGNHDQMSQIVYQECFSEVHQFVERKINGYCFTMCHYPLVSWNRSHYNKQNNSDFKKCSFMVHGHCHNRLPYSNPFLVDVGVDGWNYTPVSIEQLFKKIDSVLN